MLKSSKKLSAKSLQNDGFFENLEDIENHKTFVFYGPPGTGKTLMASAMAREADIPVILVQRNTKSVWHGETEARALAPTIDMILDGYNSLRKTMGES